MSCPAATACIAVGYSYGSSSFTAATLAEQWNGNAWSIQPTPNPSPVEDFLSGVSCTAANACIAVGFYSRGITMAERWGGSVWSVQRTPNSSSTWSSLSGVSCTAVTACTAVGTAIYPNFICQRCRPIAQKPLAERWDGSVWSVQGTPNPSGAWSSLSSVSCTAAGTCTAVGYYTNGLGGPSVTLTEEWNGSAWSIQPTANPIGATRSVLSGVSCTAANSCAAVGYYVNGSGRRLTLAERWSGTAWSIQTTPNPTGATRSILSGVSCTTATACTAAGNYVNASGTQVTLAERYSP